MSSFYYEMQDHKLNSNEPAHIIHYLKTVPLRRLREYLSEAEGGYTTRLYHSGNTALRDISKAAYHLALYAPKSQHMKSLLKAVNEAYDEGSSIISRQYGGDEYSHMTAVNNNLHQIIKTLKKFEHQVTNALQGVESSFKDNANYKKSEASLKKLVSMSPGERKEEAGKALNQLRDKAIRFIKAQIQRLSPVTKYDQPLGRMGFSFLQHEIQVGGMVSPSHRIKGGIALYVSFSGSSNPRPEAFNISGIPDDKFYNRVGELIIRNCKRARLDV